MKFSKQRAIAYLELIKMRSDLGIHRSVIANLELIEMRSDWGIYRSAIATVKNRHPINLRAIVFD